LRCLVAHASGSNAPNAKRPKLAFVSPWNTSSRIAEYGHLLVSRIPGERLVILASLGPGDDYHDQAATYRCWNEGAAFPVEELRRILHAEAVDAVAIQFNLDSGQVRSLGTLIDLITQDRVAVYLILYSDFQDDCTTVTHLSAIRDTLRGVQRLFVHSVDALNQLKALDLIDNATLLPFATAATPEAEKLAERFDSLIRGDFLQRAVDNGSACIPISVLSSPSNACNKLSDQSARPPRNAENQVSFSDYRRARIRNLRATKRLDLELFLHPDPDIVSECIDRFGHWEWTETQYVVDTIKEGDVVLDLGANLGYYTALFSRLVGERGKVYAFEPDDDNFHLLMLNIKHNRLANVLAMKAMVGRSSGIAALHLHNSENRGAHMAANLNHPNFESVAYHPQVTLDELRRVGALDRVDFIKMDTQGAEPDIVAGAREVIETNCAHLNMVVEFMPDWIERFHKRQAIDFYRELCGFGFDCFYVHPMRQEILPVTDPAELITTVTACDGIAWPERVNFVDLIMKPSARPLQSK
jgi:FkbM family methyltransferase